jgi:ankyrin repeat protein
MAEHICDNLHEASRINHHECLNLLLDRGADVNEKTHPEGWTPLHMASRNNHNECVNILLNHGASINEKNNRGMTPLHLVSIYGHCCDETLIKILLNKGADVNEKSDDGSTPLHYISASGNLNSATVIKIFLNNGANINEENNDGETPLCMAVTRSGRDDAVTTLLEHGANVNCKLRDGNSLLHYLAMRDYDFGGQFRGCSDNRIKILLKYGANPYQPNNQGQSAYDVARDDLKQIFDDHFEPIKEPDQE